MLFSGVSAWTLSRRRSPLQLGEDVELRLGNARHVAADRAGLANDELERFVTPVALKRLETFDGDPQCADTILGEAGSSGGTSSDS